MSTLPNNATSESSMDLILKKEDGDSTTSPPRLDAVVPEVGNGGQSTRQQPDSQLIPTNGAPENNENKPRENHKDNITVSDDYREDPIHDAQMLSASILATINTSLPPKSQNTQPSTPPPRSSQIVSPRAPVYPPSPTADHTPRRRSTRKIVKPRISPPQLPNSTPSRVKNRKQPSSTPTTTTSSQKKKRGQEHIHDEDIVPQPLSVLHRTIDLGPVHKDYAHSSSTNNNNAEDLNGAENDWGASVPLYKLARLWMCSNVEDSHSMPESVLLTMQEAYAPFTLPPPESKQSHAATIPPLPPHPAFPVTNTAEFDRLVKPTTSNESTTLPSPQQLLASNIEQLKKAKDWWKTDYVHRLSRYRNRLSILFPEPPPPQQPAELQAQEAPPTTSSPSQSQSQSQPQTQLPQQSSPQSQTQQPQQPQSQQQAAQPTTQSPSLQSPLPTTPPKQPST